MFFLLTLYMQQVLHYSAVKTGVAYIPLTFASHHLLGRGPVADDPAGRKAGAVGRDAALRRGAVPLRAAASPRHYFWDIFPVFVLSGIGLALSFVPVSIGGLTGVQPADAGVASGLINTSQQIGGAVGLAAAATISTTVTTHFVSSHGPASLATGAALTHGFEIAFYVFAALSLIGALAAALLVERKPNAGDAEAEAEAKDVQTRVRKPS